MTRSLFDEWRETAKETPLFDDLPVPVRDCAREGHLFAESVTVWAGENVERLTWTCAACGHVRGRA